MAADFKAEVGKWRNLAAKRPEQRALAAELRKIGEGNFSNEIAAGATMVMVELGMMKVEDLDEVPKLS